MENRIKWVDYVKVIACVFVVLGHFFQSMVKAGIFTESFLYEWFNATIYYFHVPLFFICSGFLYQKFSRVKDLKSWKRNVNKKILSLGVPYITFSIITWLLKKIFSGSVNALVGGGLESLLIQPIAPYWYLYCLFFIFLITPTFLTKKAANVGIIVAIVAKVLIILWRGCSVYAISSVLTNEIWFVIGMWMCIYNVQLKDKKKTAFFSGITFWILSVVVYVENLKNGWTSFTLGIIACTSIITFIGSHLEVIKGMKIFNFFAQYTMPIFLMHTLFAAPVRVLLFKLGITNAGIQVILGLSASFFGPIIAAYIMKKSRYLEFFIYPGKFIKIK